MPPPEDNDDIEKLLAERDDLQKKLLIHVKQCSESKKELVNSAEREEELNHKIGKLLGLIKRLKDELDMYKSSYTPEPLNDGNLDGSENRLPVTEYIGGEVTEADAHNDSAKPSKFRKFKGYQKLEKEIEDDENGTEQDFNKILTDKAQTYVERLEKGETEEEIALSIAVEKFSKGDEKEAKHKGYSPNRSFVDLLADSERRSNEHLSVNVEKAWQDSGQQKGGELESENKLEEGKSFKTILIGIFILIAITVFLIKMFFDEGGNSYEPTDSATPTDSINVAVAVQGSDDDPATDASENTIDSELTSDAELSNLELSKQALEVLQKFHVTADLEKKASLCHVPNRTLADMKEYYSTERKKYSFSDVKISPLDSGKSSLKLYKAICTGDLEGKAIAIPSYFILDEDNSLKLDWYSHIFYEPITWNEFLEMDDKILFDWHLTIGLDGDLHPDFPDEKFLALKVRSWSPEAFNITSAMLSKDDPRYKELLEAYESGERTFIFKVRHLGDISNSLVVEEIVSVGSLYEKDIDDDQ